MSQENPADRDIMTLVQNKKRPLSIIQENHDDGTNVTRTGRDTPEVGNEPPGTSAEVTRSPSFRSIKQFFADKASHHSKGISEDDKSQKQKPTRGYGAPTASSSAKITKPKNPVSTTKDSSKTTTKHATVSSRPSTPKALSITKSKPPPITTAKSPPITTPKSPPVTTPKSPPITTPKSPPITTPKSPPITTSNPPQKTTPKSPPITTLKPPSITTSKRPSITKSKVPPPTMAKPKLSHKTSTLSSTTSTDKRSDTHRIAHALHNSLTNSPSASNESLASRQTKVVKQNLTVTVRNRSKSPNITKCAKISVRDSDGKMDNDLASGGMMDDNGESCNNRISDGGISNISSPSRNIEYNVAPDENMNKSLAADGYRSISNIGGSVENAGNISAAVEHAGSSHDSNGHIIENIFSSDQDEGNNLDCDDNVGNNPHYEESMGNNPESEGSMGNNHDSEWNMGNNPDSERSTGNNPDSERSMGNNPESERSMGNNPDSGRNMGNNPDSEGYFTKQIRLQTSSASQKSCLSTLIETSETGKEFDENLDFNSNIIPHVTTSPSVSSSSTASDNSLVVHDIALRVQEMTTDIETQKSTSFDDNISTSSHSYTTVFTDTDLDINTSTSTVDTKTNSANIVTDTNKSNSQIITKFSSDNENSNLVDNMEILRKDSGISDDTGVETFPSEKNTSTSDTKTTSERNSSNSETYNSNLDMNNSDSETNTSNPYLKTPTSNTVIALNDMHNPDCVKPCNVSSCMQENANTCVRSPSATHDTHDDSAISDTDEHRTARLHIPLSLAMSAQMSSAELSSPSPLSSPSVSSRDHFNIQRSPKIIPKFTISPTMPRRYSIDRKKRGLLNGKTSPNWSFSSNSSGVSTFPRSLSKESMLNELSPHDSYCRETLTLDRSKFGGQQPLTPEMESPILTNVYRSARRGSYFFKREQSTDSLNSLSEGELLESRDEAPPISAADLKRLKETAERLQLSTRRASILSWRQTQLDDSGTPRLAPVIDDVTEGDCVNDNLTDERKQQINDALKWLRNELQEMKTQDQSLARQLLTIRDGIHQAKLRRCTAEHQNLLEDFKSELEELEEFSDVLDLPHPIYEDNPLKHIGVTRHNMHARRFSAC